MNRNKAAQVRLVNDALLLARSAAGLLEAELLRLERAGDDPVKMVPDSGNVASCVWRLVDAAGICATLSGGPAHFAGVLETTGRGFRLLLQPAALPVRSEAPWKDIPTFVSFTGAGR